MNTQAAQLTTLIRRCEQERLWAADIDVPATPVSPAGDHQLGFGDWVCGRLEPAPTASAHETLSLCAVLADPVKAPFAYQPRLAAVAAVRRYLRH